MNNINITKLAQSIYYGDNTYKPQNISNARWRAAIASARNWIAEKASE